MNWRAPPLPVRPAEHLFTPDTVDANLARIAHGLEKVEELDPEHPLRQAYVELLDIDCQNQVLLNDIKTTGNAPDVKAWGRFTREQDFLVIITNPFQVIKGAFRDFKLHTDHTATRLLFGSPHSKDKLWFGYYQDHMKLLAAQQMVEDFLRSRTIDEMTEDALDMVAWSSAEFDARNGIGAIEDSTPLRREDLSPTKDSEDSPGPFYLTAFTGSPEYVGVQDFIRSLAASTAEYEAS
jgi:hypothetical protein